MSRTTYFPFEIPIGHDELSAVDSGPGFGNFISIPLDKNLQLKSFQISNLHIPHSYNNIYSSAKTLALSNASYQLTPGVYEREDFYNTLNDTAYNSSTNPNANHPVWKSGTGTEAVITTWNHDGIGGVAAWGSAIGPNILKNSILAQIHGRYNWNTGAHRRYFTGRDVGDYIEVDYGHPAQLNRLGDYILVHNGNNTMTFDSGTNSIELTQGQYTNATLLTEFNTKLTALGSKGAAYPNYTLNNSRFETTGSVVVDPPTMSEFDADPITVSNTLNDIIGMPFGNKTAYGTLGTNLTEIPTDVSQFPVRIPIQPIVIHSNISAFIDRPVGRTDISEIFRIDMTDTSFNEYKITDTNIIHLLQSPRDLNEVRLTFTQEYTNQGFSNMPIRGVARLTYS